LLLLAVALLRLVVAPCRSCASAPTVSSDSGCSPLAGGGNQGFALIGHARAQPRHRGISTAHRFERDPTDHGPVVIRNGISTPSQLPSFAEYSPT
jgi:hypothetical protein